MCNEIRDGVCAIFTVSRNLIATKVLKTSQHLPHFFLNAAAKSGILGRNNQKKIPRNPGGTDLSDSLNGMYTQTSDPVLCMSLSDTIRNLIFFAACKRTDYFRV